MGTLVCMYMVHWYSGMWVHWYSGMWVHWYVCTLVCIWYIGMWVHWYTGKFIFYFSIVERWSHQIINEYFTKVSKCSHEKDLMKLRQLVTEIVH